MGLGDDLAHSCRVDGRVPVRQADVAAGDDANVGTAGKLQDGQGLGGGVVGGRVARVEAVARSQMGPDDAAEIDGRRQRVVSQLTRPVLAVGRAIRLKVGLAGACPAPV